jgi:hypothetical protein
MAVARNNENVKFTTLLRSLTVVQFWGIVVAAVGVIGGSAGVGAYFQEARDDDKIMEKNIKLSNITTELAQLKTSNDAKINELNGKLEQYSANFDAVTDAIKNSARNLIALKSKEEFLERFLSYKIAPGDDSKKLFVDYVCALWKQSQDMNVRVDSQPLNISPEQIRAGLPNDLKAALIDKGVPAIFFDNARILPAPPQASPFPNVSRSPIVSPSPTEAIATIQKQASSMQMVKTIHFYDGTDYRVPDEIAAAVHTDQRCSP